MLRAMDHFQTSRVPSVDQDYQRQKWFIAAREQRERKQEAEDKAEADLVDLAVSAITATQAEITRFHGKLDKYDEATTRALMENTEALEIIVAQLDGMLGRAHTMEDGRKVFKSADGTWAVDQDGTRLDPILDDINAIPPTPDTAEDYLAAKTEEQRLLQEREQLHAYQEKLDDARERSSEEGFTKQELDELEAELEAEMPGVVKKGLGLDEQVNGADLKTDIDMLQTPTRAADAVRPALGMPTMN